MYDISRSGMLEFLAARLISAPSAPSKPSTMRIVDSEKNIIEFQIASTRQAFQMQDGKLRVAVLPHTICRKFKSCHYLSIANSAATILDALMPECVRYFIRKNISSFVVLSAPSATKHFEEVLDAFVGHLATLPNAAVEERGSIVTREDFSFEKNIHTFYISESFSKFLLN